MVAGELRHHVALERVDEADAEDVVALAGDGGVGGRGGDHGHPGRLGLVRHGQRVGGGGLAQDDGHLVLGDEAGGRLGRLLGPALAVVDAHLQLPALHPARGVGLRDGHGDTVARGDAEGGLAAGEAAHLAQEDGAPCRRGAPVEAPAGEGAGSEAGAGGAFFSQAATSTVSAARSIGTRGRRMQTSSTKEIARLLPHSRRAGAPRLTGPTLTPGDGPIFLRPRGARPGHVSHPGGSRECSFGRVRGDALRWGHWACCSRPAARRGMTWRAPGPMDCLESELCHPDEKICVRTCTTLADCPRGATSCEALNTQKICECPTKECVGGSDP